MTSDATMDAIAAYATVFGPWKNTLAVVDSATPNAMPVSTGLCARAQDRGMVVTPYTFRPEVNQVISAPMCHTASMRYGPGWNMMDP